MEHINCIFCNTDSDKIVIKENNFLGRKCANCNLIYISPRPSLNEIIDLYGHGEANNTADSYIKSFFIKSLLAKHNLSIIKKYAKKGDLLEIGAGAGYFLNQAKKQGFHCYGIEFNNLLVKFINHHLNIPCEQLPLSKKTFNDKKFDIIYHCDVISHLHDPINEFKKINQKLKKNGYLIFETGNLGEIAPKYFKYFQKFYYPEHLFFFSEKNIKQLLKQTGFELIEIKKYPILPQLIIKKTFQLFKNKGKNAKKEPLLQKTQVTKEIKTTNTSFNFKQLLKNSYEYILFVLTYKLGAIFPKKGRPQTTIIIAKKISDSPQE